MNEGEVRHRLTAILAADAAGYSRVMAEDDRDALAELDAARAVFRTHIEAQGGRIFVETAASGRGTAVTMILPAAADESPGSLKPEIIDLKSQEQRTA